METTDIERLNELKEVLEKSFNNCQPVLNKYINYKLVINIGRGGVHADIFFFKKLLDITIPRNILWCCQYDNTIDLWCTDKIYLK